MCILKLGICISCLICVYFTYPFPNLPKMRGFWVSSKVLLEKQGKVWCPHHQRSCRKHCTEAVPINCKLATMVQVMILVIKIQKQVHHYISKWCFNVFLYRLLLNKLDFINIKHNSYLEMFFASFNLKGEIGFQLSFATDFLLVLYLFLNVNE